MPRTTQAFVLRLDTLIWHVDPPPDEPQGLGRDVRGFSAYQWPMFFKIDGLTASVDAAAKLNGTATVIRPPELGSTHHLDPLGTTAVRAEVAQWSDQVVPIPVAVADFGPDVGGIFGFAFLMVQPGGLDGDALNNGYNWFAASLQRGLDDLIANFPAGQTTVPQDLIDALVKAVTAAVRAAVKATLDLFGELVELLIDQPQFGSTFAYFNQDDLPAADFDQSDFDPSSHNGPGLIDWPADVVRVGSLGTTPGRILLGGSISRSRRTVGDGVIGGVGRPARFVAGYATADGVQHAIAAATNGEVTEWWWPGGAPATANLLARFDHQIVGLAGYQAADGSQHVIVPTADGAVTEVYWPGGGAVNQGSLGQFSRPITAVAGWADGNGYQHVLVATDDGELTELWWQAAGDVGRGSLTHLDGPFVDAAGFWADGIHHAFVLTRDGSVVEVTWTGDGAPPATSVLTQLPADWTPMMGLAAYRDAWEDHVIVGLYDGRLRELHGAPGAVDRLHTDLGIVAGLSSTIDAYVDPSGYQHVIAASRDNDLHELWWSPAVSVIFNP